MPLQVIRQIGQAFQNLKPAELRQSAERPVKLGLEAGSGEAIARMESFFCPPHLSPRRRAEVGRLLIRGNGPADIRIFDQSLLRPVDAFEYDAEQPHRTVRAILARHPDLWLPLARAFAPFRRPVSYRLIRKISRENALFALASALPNVVPGVFSLPWAIGEFASDAAVLTTNQVRLTFLLAAASDRAVGYREQRGEIATLVTGAFGWRALARELVGKLPLGAGLIPKAAVAWAGTFVAGLSMERLYRLGSGLTRAERKEAHQEAYRHGRQVAGQLLARLRKAS